MTKPNPPHLASVPHAPLEHQRRPAPHELVRWVSEQTERGCHCLTLRQRYDTGERLVRTWEVTPESDADEIARAIDARVDLDGRQLHGSTLFCVYSFIESARDYVDRMLLRVEGEAFPRSAETESPTAMGLAAQLMRHNEFHHKQGAGNAAVMLERYEKMLARADARVAELEAKLAEGFAAREAVLSEENERRIAMMRLERDTKYKDEMFGEFKKHLPALLGELARRSRGTAPAALPQGAATAAPATSSAPNGSVPPSTAPAPLDPLVALLMRLVHSLLPHQVEQLGRIFDDEQSGMLGHLIISVGQRSDDPEIVAAANAPPPPRDAETRDVAPDASATHVVDAGTNDPST